MMRGHEAWSTRDYGGEGSAVTMSKSQLGEFLWWVLKYEGQITQSWAMALTPRAHCQFVVTLPAGKKEAFELDSGFTLEKISELKPALATPTASAPALIDPQPEIEGDPLCKIVSYNQAHEEAVEMGYPSLTEALEHLSELREARPATDPGAGVREAATALVEQMLGDVDSRETFWAWDRLRAALSTASEPVAAGVREAFNSAREVCEKMRSEVEWGATATADYRSGFDAGCRACDAGIGHELDRRDEAALSEARPADRGVES